MIDNPYYDSEKPLIFHQCEDCSTGSKIQNKVQGRRPEAVLCHECASLMTRQARGHAQPGGGA